MVWEPEEEGRVRLWEGAREVVVEMEGAWRRGWEGEEGGLLLGAEEEGGGMVGCVIGGGSGGLWASS
jgi:hypothetical protein